MSSRFFSSLPALVLGLTLSACLQTNGETCQLNSDCESGNCCKGLLSGVDVRGICSSERCPTPPPADAGPGDEVDAAIDAAIEDAGPDAGAVEDAGPDASAPDSSTPDSSTPDSSTPDSSIPDAATDAGTDAGDAI